MVHISILLEHQYVFLIKYSELYNIIYFNNNILSDIYYQSTIMMEFIFSLPVTRLLFYQNHLINLDCDSTLLELVNCYIEATVQVFLYYFDNKNLVINYNQYLYHHLYKNVLSIIYLEFISKFQINYNYITFQQFILHKIFYHY